MIGSALGSEIERFADETRLKNPVFARTREGKLTPDRVGAYLANVHFLISHTPFFLTRAGDRARELGDPKLAEHFAHKFIEEHGHDAWAERDVSRLAAIPGNDFSRKALPSMVALTDFLTGIVEGDPVLFLAYELFAEYLIVILGPEWLTMLEERCGIPRSSMTVIANHVELDKDHVEEGLETIDDLVGDPRKLPELRETLRTTFELFDKFCAELIERGEASDAGARAIPHFNAA